MRVLSYNMIRLLAMHLSTCTSKLNFTFHIAKAFVDAVVLYTSENRVWEPWSGPSLQGLRESDQSRQPGTLHWGLHQVSLCDLCSHLLTSRLVSRGQLDNKMFVFIETSKVDVIGNLPDPISELENNELIPCI